MLNVHRVDATRQNEYGRAMLAEPTAVRKTRPTRWALALACVLAAASGCKRQRSVEPLRVLLAGCVGVHRGGTCEISGSARLVLHVRTRADEVALMVDGNVVTPALVQRVEDGVRIEAAISGERELSVVATEMDGPRQWRVALRQREPVEAVADAQLIARTSGAEAAIARLERVLDGADDALKSTITSALGRLLAESGRREHASARLRESLSMHRHLGRVAQEVDDAVVIARLGLEDAADLGGLKRLLTAMGTVPDFAADRAAELAIARARLDLRLGSTREAALDLEQADGLARRLGLTEVQREIAALRGVATTPLDEGSDCRAAALDLTPVEAALEAPHGGAGSKRSGELRTQAEALVGLAKRTCLPTSPVLARSHALLAIASALDGRADAAEAALIDAKQVLASGTAPEVGADVLRARILVAETRRDTRTTDDLLDDLWLRARAARNVGLAQWAAYHVGRVREQAGVLESALIAYDLALAVEETTPGATITHGASVREDALGRRVAIALRLGKEGDALSALRRQNRRAWLERLRDRAIEGTMGQARTNFEERLADLESHRASFAADAVREWRLPRSEVEGLVDRLRSASRMLVRLERLVLNTLPALLPSAISRPAPGEVILSFVRIPSGTAGFLLTESGLSTAAIDDTHGGDSPMARAQALAEPFGSQLAPAQRVRVVGDAATLRLPWHALPDADGRTLGSTRAVVRSTDLGLTGGVGLERACLIASGAGIGAGPLAVALSKALPLGVQSAIGARHGADLARKCARSASVLAVLGQITVAGVGGREVGLKLAAGGWWGTSEVAASEFVPRFAIVAGDVVEGGRDATARLCETLAAAGTQAVLCLLPSPALEANRAALLDAVGADLERWFSDAPATYASLLSHWPADAVEALPDVLLYVP